MEDFTARADIVALQSQMQIVTRFLSEQFPDEWGTPSADGLGLCPTCGENNWHNCWRCKTCDPVPEIDGPTADECPDCDQCGIDLGHNWHVRDSKRLCDPCFVSIAYGAD